MKALPLYLPALRGKIGDWAYYSCLMTFKDLTERVNTASEIHDSKCLSDFIQRQLQGERTKEIARYIIENKSRFFNSIVIAVYGGEPEWYQLDHLRSIIDSDDDFIEDNITDSAVASIGFLSLSGSEKLFALDGQHRLIGIKKSLETLEGNTLIDEEVSVIFVAHNKTESGLKRTRRLFIDLNKTAKPVKKSEIIALDEADVMAIVTRWLIEEDDLFSDKKILISPSTAMPAKDRDHWTNINNLYDLLNILFLKIKPKEENKNIKKIQLTTNRLPDKELLKHKEYADKYFLLLKENFKEIKEYFNSNTPKNIVAKYRHDKGGSILFRPAGLLLFADLIFEYLKIHNCKIENAFKAVSNLNTNMSETPYNITIWSTSENKLNLKRRPLLFLILKYQLGLVKNSKEIEKMRKKLAEIHEKEIELPPILI